MRGLPLGFAPVSASLWRSATSGISQRRSATCGGDIICGGDSTSLSVGCSRRRRHLLRLLTSSRQHLALLLISFLISINSKAAPATSKAVVFGSSCVGSLVRCLLLRSRLCFRVAEPKIEN